MNSAKILEKIDNDITRYGWHCLSVNACTGEEGAPFTYTIGLQTTHQHPEIMIFALSNQTAHGILSDCVSLIQNGRRFQPDQEYADVIGGGYQVIFRQVRDEHLPEYFGAACRYYRDAPFSALILFWPNKNHRFPWEDEGATPQDEALGLIL